MILANYDSWSIIGFKWKQIFFEKPIVFETIQNQLGILYDSS